MFTAHSPPNINIKDFLLTIRNSVIPLKIQEILVCFTKPIKTIKHKKVKNDQKHNSLVLPAADVEEKLTVQGGYFWGIKKEIINLWFAEGLKEIPEAEQ